MTETQLHVPDPSELAQPISDPLSDVLGMLKLNGTFHCQSSLTAPWAIAVPEFPDVLSFFVPMQGRCWLRRTGEAPVLVDQGSLVILTDDRPFDVSSDVDTPPVSLEALPIRKVSDVYETLSYGGGGDETRLMFGILRFDRAAGAMLIDQLPDMLQVEAWTSASGWLTATLQFIAREAADLKPGGEAVILRLADVVIIEAIRSWAAVAPDADGGWLGALRDPQIARAIAAIHGAPGQDWTLVRLAQTAGMSRSAFAARFSQQMGTSAMRYLAYWRMMKGRDMLLMSSRPIAGIAADLGYQSEPAFSRAFRRQFGAPPGQVRKASAGASAG